MLNAPLKVVVTRRLPEPVETRMRELFDVELNETDEKMDAAALAGAMKRADVLVPTLGDVIDQKMLAQAGENLRLIANYGAGFRPHRTCKPPCNAGSWYPTPPAF